MNGKIARRTRRIAGAIAAEKLWGTDKAAPWAVCGLPAHALVRDLQSGAIRLPAETGRFYYQKLKRAYRAFRRSLSLGVPSATEAAQRAMDNNDALSMQLIKRIGKQSAQISEEEARASEARRAM